MTEKTVVILENGQLGPFDDPKAALTYLDKLGLEGKVIPLTTPPPMSDLLVTALAVVREHGDDPDLFVKKMDNVDSDTPLCEETLRETFQAAVELYETAFKLSNEALALKLLRKNDWSRLATIRALRKERPMGVGEAHTLVLRAEVAWFSL